MVIGARNLANLPTSRQTITTLTIGGKQLPESRQIFRRMNECSTAEASGWTLVRIKVLNNLRSLVGRVLRAQWHHVLAPSRHFLLGPKSASFVSRHENAIRAAPRSEQNSESRPHHWQG